MAAAWLTFRHGTRYEADGTGFRNVPPGRAIVDAMREIGIAPPERGVPSVLDLIKARRHYDFVVTLCDPGEPLPYPVYPGEARRIHWRVHDPDKLIGDMAMRMDLVRHIRSRIVDCVESWVFNSEPVSIRELA